MNMKRVLFLLAATTFGLSQAQASGGFSCEADDKNVTRLVIEGATPRSEPGLINFGGVLELDGRKVEFKLGDVKSFTGRNGVIRLRAVAQSADERVTVSLNVRRNPKDEDDWPGTYEVELSPSKADAKSEEKSKAKDKSKPNIKRGKVKCSVE